MRTGWKPLCPASQRHLVGDSVHERPSHRAVRGVFNSDPGAGLVGRRSECEVLDRLLADVRAHQSRVLVLRGEAGVGKTALMDYLARTGSGCRVVRAAGVESEMELAFAGAHQLCAPVLDRMDDLPGPQRDALGTAFGLVAGVPADRFLVGLAVLTLLSAAAEERPLVCLVDDAQWLDQLSGQILAFVARRLLAESIALVFAVREPSDPLELAGLPERKVGGLADGEARALLDSVFPGRLDERVRDRIVAETRGNPLALLELPRGSDRRRAGRWLRRARDGAVGRTDRARLPHARPIAPGADTATVAHRRRRTLGRCDPAAARRRAARHRG